MQEAQQILSPLPTSRKKERKPHKAHHNVIAQTRD